MTATAGAGPSTATEWAPAGQRVIKSQWRCATPKPQAHGNPAIADSRALLEQYAAQPLDQGQVLVENGTFGELEPGGADRIARNPVAEGDAGDLALDNVSMEIGAD